MEGGEDKVKENFVSKATNWGFLFFSSFPFPKARGACLHLQALQACLSLPARVHPIPRSWEKQLEDPILSDYALM
jgi:hypothetical protein